MVITAKETGKPDVVVDGDKYTIATPCTAYNEDNTVVASESLVITGLTTETAKTVKAKISKAMETWRLKVVAAEEFKAKLGDV